MDINIEHMLPCLLADWVFVLDDIKTVLQFIKSTYRIDTTDFFICLILQSVSMTE